MVNFIWTFQRAQWTVETLDLMVTVDIPHLCTFLALIHFYMPCLFIQYCSSCLVYKMEPFPLLCYYYVNTRVP